MTVRYLCLLILSLLVTAAFAAPEASSVRIGVLAYEGREQAEARWQTTADYLTQQIPGHRFTVVPLTHAEFEHAINQEKLDFVLTNPAHFARLNIAFGVSRIATFIANPHEQPQARFSAVLFTRSDSDIKSLQDLRGKRLAAVSEAAFGGYQLARDLLLQHGLDTHTDLQTQWFGFPHSAVVHAVLANKADVGTVRSGVLENMAEQGELGLAQIAVLAPRNNDGYPLLHSVDLYPEWPFARLTNTSSDLSRQVALALMSMHPDHPASRRAEGAGWTIPLSDHKVHAVLKRLQVSPYLPQAPTLTELLDHYSHWLAAIAALLLVMLALLLRVSRNNARLRHNLQKLHKEQGQLEEAFRLGSQELANAERALQHIRQRNSGVEQDLHNACDAVSSLYELFLREDLQTQQRLDAMVEAVRHQLDTEIGQLSRIKGNNVESRVLTAVSKTGGHEFNAPLSATESQKAITLRDLHRCIDTAEWKTYLACPVYLEGELHCLLEFATPASSQALQHNGNPAKQPASELALNLLNLVAQWISMEIDKEEQNAQKQQRLETLQQRFSSITPREGDVLLRLVKGESNKEIARSLELSPKTVEMHRASLLRKTQAKSSTELVQLAVTSELYT